MPTRTIAATIALMSCTSERDLFEQRRTDAWDQAPNNQVDVLWVIDDSGSMAERQASLVAGFASFAAQLDASLTDFHLGVITTTFEPGEPGAGVLIGEPAYLTSDDPGYELLFAARAAVGTDGADREKGLQAATFALHPSMTLEGGPNEGFVRRGAQLLVIVVSDEEDCSDNGLLDGNNSVDACLEQRELLPPVSSFVQELRDLKADVDMVQIAAIVGSEDSRCDVNLGGRYIASALLTGGLIGDICESDYSSILADLGLTASGIRSQFQLSSAARPETLQVTIDGGEVLEDPDEGWTYDPDTWFVTFHGGAIPPRDSYVEATYTIQPGVPAPPADAL